MGYFCTLFRRSAKKVKDFEEERRTGFLFSSKFLKRGRGGKTFLKKFFPRHLILN
jgi:hypothetical protein